MKTIKEVTVSFEMAKAMNEAGWEEDTFMGYIQGGHLDTMYDGSIPAPTLEEILRALPTSPKGIDPSQATLVVEKDGIMFGANYQLSSWWGSSFVPKKTTLANAAATLWLKMKKEDLL